MHAWQQWCFVRLGYATCHRFFMHMQMSGVGEEKVRKMFWLAYDHVPSTNTADPYCCVILLRWKSFCMLLSWSYKTKRLGLVCTHPKVPYERVFFRSRSWARLHMEGNCLFLSNSQVQSISVVAHDFQIDSSFSSLHTYKHPVIFIAHIPQPSMLLDRLVFDIF
jgi:hypothetical protein